MKYKKFNTIALPNRTWPNNEITEAPVWCSVDLRDGNQALIKPMSLEKKVRFFNLLVEIGFKEIEIGFPSASEVEYEFTRHLIENDLIPDDVSIQILTQAREHLIKKSAEALRGAKNIIVHLYNPTSTMQREIVYDKSQDEIVDIALNGVKWIKDYFKDFGKENDGSLRFEYSPESFTQTELDYAVNISNAVIEAWNPQGDEKMILNLPSTVESATPNIYADQIEYMSTNIVRRENVLISVHAHNDRGCAVASTELGLMAGADRVEGTLLGNGERTGNVDIVTVGLNMYTQGVDPKLDFSDVDKIVEVVEASNEIKTHIRHPYVGDLVYTAFSGSHQDA
ncbi:MAG TPA: 2-isopropylmalate synthase, partial [Campylobacterales bacterium]|nr:2-isopropylmalate synthase [Campylobacterales bacterium]